MVDWLLYCPLSLLGKRIAMFDFRASSYLGIKGNTTEIQTKLDILSRLESTGVVPWEDFVAVLQVG
jgi:hypothetical protein